MAKTGRRRGSKGSGWGIPFPKVMRKSGGFTQAIHGSRTDEDLERLQQEWAQRYTARVRAHRLLGASMGTPLEDIEENYQLLLARVTRDEARREEITRAFRLVQDTAEVGGTRRMGDGAGQALSADDADDQEADGPDEVLGDAPEAPLEHQTPLPDHGTSP